MFSQWCDEIRLIALVSAPSAFKWLKQYETKGKRIKDTNPLLDLLDTKNYRVFTYPCDFRKISLSR